MLPVLGRIGVKRALPVCRPCFASYNRHKRGKEMEGMGGSYCTVSVVVKMLPASFIGVGEYYLFCIV